MKINNSYLYFFYSPEYENMRNEAEAVNGLRFMSGTVIDSGTKKKFSYIGKDKLFMRMYPDAKLIAEGYEGKIQYIDPIIEPRRGN